jgi:uncharacterized damage-inducible protein DinB
MMRDMPPGEKERSDLLTILLATPETLTALTAKLTDKDANRREQPPDEWSIAEIAAHLLDAEQSWLERRVRLMKEQDDPFLPYYPDLDLNRPLQRSLAELRAARAKNVAYLEALAPADWERPGNHERWGPITILWAVRHIAAHDAEHLAQIGRRVATPLRRRSAPPPPRQAGRRTS